MDRFKNSRDRLDRAYVHYQAFILEWQSILDDKSAAPVIRKDERPGWGRLSIVPTPECVERIKANRLPLILGEYAYQLRAALDSLMWDAITYTQGSEPPADASNIDFPILNGKVRDFQKCGFHKYPFPPNLTAWLESVQPDAAEKPEGDPDRGMKSALEDIHNLARFDRHRRLRVVGVVPFSAGVEFATSPPGAKVIASEWLDCDIFGGKYDFLRFKVVAAGGLTPLKVILKTKASFEVWVEDILRYDDSDIGVHLGRFIQAVERVLQRFEEEFL